MAGSNVVFVLESVSLRQSLVIVNNGQMAGIKRDVRLGEVSVN